MHLEIPAGVFHPGLYFSTGLFIEFLGQIDLKGKKVLDLGCGSGALALFAAKGGAKVLAVDINPLATACTRENARRNGLEKNLTVLESDLLNVVLTDPNFKDYSPDFILINPPYYPKNAENDEEKAFFAGEGLHYFRELFQQLPKVSGPSTCIWLILSEDCPMQALNRLAAEQGAALDVFWEKRKFGERFSVYRFLIAD